MMIATTQMSRGNLAKLGTLPMLPKLCPEMTWNTVVRIENEKYATIATLLIICGIVLNAWRISSSPIVHAGKRKPRLLQMRAIVINTQIGHKNDGVSTDSRVVVASFSPFRFLSSMHRYLVDPSSLMPCKMQCLRAGLVFCSPPHSF